MKKNRFVKMVQNLYADGYKMISIRKESAMKEVIIRMINELDERQLRLVFWFIKNLK